MIKKIFSVILAIVVISFVVFVVFFIYKQIKMAASGQSISLFGSSLPSVSPVSPTNNDISHTVTKNITIDDPDLNGLNSTLENIRQAILDNNIFLLNKYYSQPTLSAFAS